MDARNPRRAQPPKRAPANTWTNTRGVVNQLLELVARESAKHGGHTIVPRHRVKSQQDTRNPESGGGDPAAAQIADDHRAARHAMQLRNDMPRVILHEMMQ